MTRIIVTGGAGFIGSHLVEKLKAEGHEVKVVDIKIDPDLDIRNREALTREFAGFDTVFHLAALASVPYSIDHPEETHETNLTGTLNVLGAAKAAGVRRVVFSSSAAVYGDQERLPVREDVQMHPMSPYAMQKLASEMYLQHFALIQGVETVSLRYFNVYGEGQDPDGPYAGAIPKFVKMKREGKPLTLIGDGSQTRDFVHVQDVVQANIAAMTNSKVGKGEAVNIATGEPISMSKVAELIGGPVEHLPPRPEIKNSVADITLAKELLDWAPQVAFEEGLRGLL